MLLTMILLLLLAVGLGFFVLVPLFTGLDATHVLAGSVEDEAEFKRMIHFRDSLLVRLKGGIVDNFPEIGRLNEEQALEALVGICRSLRKLGLPPLPTSNEDSSPDQGQSKEAHEKRESSLTRPNPCLLMALGSSLLLSQIALPSQASANQKMPGLTRDESGISMAQVHQFVLSPGQGEMRVYYMTIFASDAPDDVKLRIPSPTGATDFDFSSLPSARFSADEKTEAPLLEFTSTSGINQVQGLFTVPVFSGSFEWQSKTLGRLPGVVLVILPEYSDFLSAVFGDTFTRLGIWPPRFVSFASDLELKRTADPPAERDPNFARLKAPPAQFSFHLFRKGADDAPYPQFKVSGIAPSRIPGSVLVSSFGALLAGIALLLAFHPGFARRTPKAEESPKSS